MRVLVSSLFVMDGKGGSRARVGSGDGRRHLWGQMSVLCVWVKSGLECVRTIGCGGQQRDRGGDSILLVKATKGAVLGRCMHGWLVVRLVCDGGQRRWQCLGSRGARRHREDACRARRTGARTSSLPRRRDRVQRGRGMGSRVSSSGARGCHVGQRRRVVVRLVCMHAREGPVAGRAEPVGVRLRRAAA